MSYTDFECTTLTDMPVNEPGEGLNLYGENGYRTGKVNYGALARSYLEDYEGSELAGVRQTVKAALDRLRQDAEALSADLETLRLAVGAPMTAGAAEDMTDAERIYVYTGNETGYSFGHWYYWDGESWTDGGVYNSAAVETDPTLRVSGAAADAAAVGGRLDAAEEALQELRDEGLLEDLDGGYDYQVRRYIKDGHFCLDFTKEAN